MKKVTTDAVEILKRRYIGKDKKRLAQLDRERINAEVARQIYSARRRAGLNQKQLADRIGTTQSVISRLEDADYGGHTIRILTRIAKALGEDLKVSITDGKRLPERPGDLREEEKGLIELVKGCPAKEMVERNWVDRWETPAELEARIRAFLGSRRTVVAGHYRLSRPSGVNEVVLTCWLTKLEIEAWRISVPKFRSTVLKAEIPELVKLSSRPDGPVRAVKWLEDRGVRCLFVRHLAETYLDGGVMLSDDAKPTIGLTLRYNRLDNFWFTLLHEVGHILLHRRTLIDSPILDEQIDKEPTDRIEREADRFATNAWVSPKRWRQFRQSVGAFARLQDIRNFAADLHVCPALVAGRLRHDLKKYTHYKDFLGEGTLQGIIEKHYKVF